MTTETKKVPLRISNNKAYVWNVDDIATLRSEYRICGILVGTLPHLSQQNVFLGIPLVLMPEEVVLLVEKEMAVLVDDPTAHTQPHFSDIKSWNDEQQANFRQQIAQVEAKSAKSEASRSLSEEAMKKRREREERKRLVAQKQDIVMGTDHPRALPPTSSSSSPQPSEQPTSSNTYTIVVPASSSDFPWYSPEKSTYASIEAAQSAGIWTYPSNLHERAKCGVFRALWEKNYFIGGGIKFGGDYLVYPGDPLRYHSHFVATVIDSPSHVLRPMEIVAHGRLGTATKKSHLLCTWDNDKKEVNFLSIEWAGFG